MHVNFKFSLSFDACAAMMKMKSKHYMMNYACKNRQCKMTDLEQSGDIPATLRDHDYFEFWIDIILCTKFSPPPFLNQWFKAAADARESNR